MGMHMHMHTGISHYHHQLVSQDQQFLGKNVNSVLV